MSEGAQGSNKIAGRTLEPSTVWRIHNSQAVYMSLPSLHLVKSLILFFYDSAYDHIATCTLNSTFQKHMGKMISPFIHIFMWLAICFDQMPALLYWWRRKLLEQRLSQ